MSIEANKQLVREAYDSISRGDVDGFMNRLADDVRWTFFGSHRFAGTFNGKAEILEGLFAGLGDQLVDGIKLTLTNVIAEGDQVVVEARGDARTKDGSTYNNIYCYVVTVRAGKIAEMREYLDTELVSNVFGRKQ